MLKERCPPRPETLEPATTIRFMGRADVGGLTDTVALPMHLHLVVGVWGLRTAGSPRHYTILPSCKRAVFDSLPIKKAPLPAIWDGRLSV